MEFFALLGGGPRDAGWDGASRPRGQLAILPGTTHYDISVRPILAEAVIPFLDAAVCQPVSWAMWPPFHNFLRTAVEK